MKDIYIIQSYSGTMPAKLIKLFTKYKYSHISLSLDDKLTNMYSFGRKKPNNPFNGRFIIENIDGKFYEKFSNTHCRIYKIKITKQQYYKLIKYLNQYQKNPDKYKYDIAGLILKLFKINLKRNNHYVCTHFVGEVISHCNIYHFNKPVYSLKPQDFERIPLKEQVYVGKIKEYQN